jgi:hypothetical protein
MRRLERMRLFNYGRLELRGTGVDDSSLPLRGDPLELRRALQDGMARLRKRQRPSPWRLLRFARDE